MPDARLESLRRRWEQNPDSRVFLQLAEEYRRAGKLEEAIEVLETGLEKHPGSLAAHVALGRCRLESGEPEAAVRSFERVLREDATHLVALKNAVLAYQAMGEDGRGMEKLDLYRALNPSDAEIEEIESLLDVPQRPASATPPRRPAEEPAPSLVAATSAGASAFGPAGPRRTEPFALEPVELPAPDLWRLLGGGEEPTPAPEGPPAGGAATATLGRLYLEQGHLGEAEGAFREVLARDPGDEAAHRGLAEVERRRAGSGADAELRARRAAALRNYLTRIQRARERS